SPPLEGEGTVRCDLK
ncbi:hypothetical protein VCHC55B2_2777B, partial [Vibrio cholerae HC-55B2]